MGSLPVHLTSALELLIMTPLCLWLYRAYHQGWASRYAIEIITAVLQITGTYYFYGAGLISHWDLLRTRATQTNFFDFSFLFLFGNIICPMVWVVVPLACIFGASKDISHM